MYSNGAAEREAKAVEAVAVPEFVRRLSTLDNVVDIAEEGVALGCFTPPTVLQSRLREEDTCAFDDTADGTLGDAVGLRAMWSGHIVSPAEEAGGLNGIGLAAGA